MEHAHPEARARQLDMARQTRPDHIHRSHRNTTIVANILPKFSIQPDSNPRRLTIQARRITIMLRSWVEILDDLRLMRRNLI